MIYHYEVEVYTDDAEHLPSVSEFVDFMVKKKGKGTILFRKIIIEAIAQ